MSLDVPESREVRLANGIIEGEVESIAFDIYSGDASSLARQMVRLELIMERDRSRCVEAFASLLKRKLNDSGYIVASDIETAERAWHEGEILG